MAVSLKGEGFQNRRLLGSNATYQDVRMSKCSFTACHLAQFDDPQFSLIVKDSTIEECRLDRCSIQGVFFDNVAIRGLAVKQIHRHMAAYSAG